jgi:hypothetical protein
MTRTERKDIAKARLVKILKVHKVAAARTLEQKISDAGPNPMRVDPHVLTTARAELEHNGRIIRINRDASTWYALASTPEAEVEAKLQILIPIHMQLCDQAFNMRLGQSLEIAIFRALCASNSLQFLGGFLDLDAHDDSGNYRKEEPPTILSGRRMPGDRRFDFVAFSDLRKPAGIEAKNVREWLYPNRDEVRDLLLKACAVRAIPVLIARRIPFVTFKLFRAIGGIIHQMYNQRFPSADAALAARAADKNLLGYHDIRLGNQPDARLLKFIRENLPPLLAPSHARFTTFLDILHPYANAAMPYAEFAARVRRRVQGTPEDFDPHD